MDRLIQDSLELKTGGNVAGMVPIAGLSRLREAIQAPWRPGWSAKPLREDQALPYTPLMKRFLIPAATALLVAAVSLSAASKPNIIVLITDDAGYADFGCYGGTQIPTPHIDSIARDGIRFTQGYVSASVCCPSRAGLLTGRYQQRFGHEFNGFAIPQPGFGPEDMGLDPDETTIAEALKPLGYRTMIVGKWHMGVLDRFHPKHHGFDEFFGIKGGSRSYFGVEKKGISEGWKLYRNDEIIPESEIGYLTDMLTDEAIAYVERNKQRPFFLYLSYTAVHGPMHGKPEDIGHFEGIGDKKRRTFAAMDKALDDGVGRLLRTLKENGLEEDTLLFFINDNGGATSNASDNGPLRGMKGSKWEGGIRVPYMVKWPERLGAGTVYNHPVISLDIAATAIAAAGGSPGKRPKALDGVDLLPFLTGANRKPPHDTLFWRRGVAAAVRQGPWKLIRSKTNPPVLVNLADDLGETRNLASEKPDIVARLATKLTQWERELAPPKWREGERWSKNQIYKHRMDVIGRDMERKIP